MTYKQLCEDNKKLYGQLEQLTLAIKELDVVADAGQYALLIEEKKYVNSLINTNLEKLDDLLTVAKQPVLPRKSYRKPEKGEGRAVQSYYMKTHAPLKDIAAHFDISVSQVSRYVTEYLANKYG